MIFSAVPRGMYRDHRKTEGIESFITTFQLVYSVGRRYRSARTGSRTLVGPSEVGEPVSRSKLVVDNKLPPSLESVRLWAVVCLGARS